MCRCDQVHVEADTRRSWPPRSRAVGEDGTRFPHRQNPEREQEPVSVDLSGKVAIVTGAGRGIGAAVAAQLAAQGAHVVVNDLGVTLDGQKEGVSPADELVEQINATGKAWADASDISDYDAVGSLVESTISRFGDLDIVVNCAGILRDRMIFNMSQEEWDAVIKVHLKGSFNLARHASNHWREHKDGQRPRRLINFTSHAGLHGLPGQPNYAAAKMGIVGLTYSCANALERYMVTANAISPGASTRMTATIPGERKAAASIDEMSSSHVAAAVGWLASDESQWCNGQVIRVRGREIGLYEKPRIVARIVAENGWAPEDINAFAEPTFEPIVSVNTAPGARKASAK